MAPAASWGAFCFTDGRHHLAHHLESEDGPESVRAARRAHLQEYPRPPAERWCGCTPPKTLTQEGGGQEGHLPVHSELLGVAAKPDF